MNKKRISMTVAAAAGLALASGLVAAPKPDDVVTYRQGVFFAMGWNVGTMGAMVKGEIPFDAERFAFLAARTAHLSPMVLEGFTPDTRDAKSHALSKLWNNLDDFERRMKELNESTQALAAAAKGGDEATMKQQFGKTVDVCKDCHDEYREKM